MPKIYTAVKAIIKKDDKYFVMKQKVNGKEFFDLPGGRMNYGENPFEALYREVKEEIGLEIEIEKIQGVWWFFREVDNDQVVCITFLCKQIGGKLDLTKNPDLEEYISFYNWLSKEEILRAEYIQNDSQRKIFESLD